jgi:hypothetical protein
MRREGASMAEIAARTGLHEGSVRRILYNVARKVTRPADSETVGEAATRGEEPASDAGAPSAG